MNINEIPKETLLHILSLYQATETQLNVVKIITRVSRTWNDFAFDSYLWKTYDGTLPFPYFLHLCEKGVLKNTRDVKFSQTPRTVKSTDLSKIFQNLPRVKRINFFAVVLNESFLANLEDKCPELCEMIFGNEKVWNKCKIPCDTFEKFFMVRGPKLTHLDFSTSYIVELLKLFVIVSRTCPNLEELLARNMQLSTNCKFPIEHVQHGCRKLKVLRLGWPITFRSKDKKSCRGFPELEVFAHNGNGDIAFTNDLFHRLLFMSKKLKVLDFRRCLELTADTVCSLPATDLQRLFMSESKINSTKTAQHLLEKWRHSLIEIDMSRNDLEKPNDIQDSLIQFIGMPNLKNLSIHYTIFGVFIFHLNIENYAELSNMQLEKCRNIGRNILSVYNQNPGYNPFGKIINRKRKI